MKHKPTLLALGVLLVCAFATAQQTPRLPMIESRIQSTSASISSSANLVNSGQEEVVEAKVAAIAVFSNEAGDYPPVIPSDIRSLQLLDAPAALRAVVSVKTRVLEEFHDPRFVVVHRKLKDALAAIGEKDLSYKIAPNGQRAVTSTSFYELLNKIADLVKNVTNQTDVRTTFTVFTKPPGATFELCPQYLTEGCVHVT